MKRFTLISMFALLSLIGSSVLTAQTKSGVSQTVVFAVIRTSAVSSWLQPSQTAGPSIEQNTLRKISVSINGERSRARDFKEQANLVTFDAKSSTINSPPSSKKSKRLVTLTD